MLVHPWGCNADIGCGAKTLRCASVSKRRLTTSPRSGFLRMRFAKALPRMCGG